MRVPRRTVGGLPGVHSPLGGEAVILKVSVVHELHDALDLRRSSERGMTSELKHTTHPVEVLLPSRRVREVLVFYLAAQRLCPEDIHARPPVPGFSTTCTLSDRAWTGLSENIRHRVDSIHRQPVRGVECR